MNHIAIDKFRSVFFQLVVFGHWKFACGNNTYYTLTKESEELFDVGSEKWIKLPKRQIQIDRKRKCIASDQVSLYDLEVLKSNGFEVIYPNK